MRSSLPRRPACSSAAVLAFVAVVALVPACSKSTSPYSSSGPPAGGGTTFDLAFPAQGASQTFTFPDSGSFPYHCRAHGSSGMTGVVDVTASGADSDTVAVGVNGAGSPALRYTPSSVAIRPGGNVRWINRSAMTNHTVTSG